MTTCAHGMYYYYSVVKTVYSVLSAYSGPHCTVSTALHSLITHPEIKNSYIRMLFVDFSSAFNTVSTWSWLENWTLWSTTQCNWILDYLNKQTLDSSDWQSHRLYVSSLGLCAKPPPPSKKKLHNHDYTSRHHRYSTAKYQDSHITNNDGVHMGRKINNQQSGSQGPIHCLALDYTAASFLMLNIPLR